MKSRTKDVGIYRPKHAWQFSDGDDVHARIIAGQIMRVDGDASSRVLTRDQAAAFAASLRASGKTVVFTNGVFDLLHPGHVRYLEVARNLGDALILGLNADASVRRNKGPERPINPEAERAEVLAGLQSVDAVVLFDEDTPDAIVKAVQPDILVKGADWPADQIVGRDTVEARGGRVVLVPIEQGHSTTTIVERVRGATPAVLDRGLDLRHNVWRDDRHVVLFPGVGLCLGQDLVRVLPNDHSVAARHEIAALQDFRHATPPWSVSCQQSSARRTRVD